MSATIHLSDIEISIDDEINAVAGCLSPRTVVGFLTVKTVQLLKLAFVAPLVSVRGSVAYRCLGSDLQTNGKDI
ncbi:MAG: hypothetical protein AAAC47_02630 [Pararhizobium sp.]